MKTGIIGEGRHEVYNPRMREVNAVASVNDKALF